MNEALQNWLAEELQKRGWSGQKLARQIGLTQPYVARILSGRQPPSANFCNRVAIALDVPPETVLRLAGILPGEPSPTDQPGPVTAEILRLAESVPPDHRRQLLEALRLAVTYDEYQRDEWVDYSYWLIERDRRNK